MIFISILLSFSFGKTISFADSCYNARALHAKGDKADRAHIDKTIQAYRSLLSHPKYAERAAVGLIKSEYFRIRFATKSEKEKEKLTEHAKVLGDSLHKWFPKNKELTSIYVTLYSAWGAQIGPLKAVKQGAAARVRDLADSAKDYQILGRAHQLLPYIPLILSWPEKQLAYKYLLLSLKEKPEDLYTYLFLAELYIDDSEYEKAKDIINKALKRGIRNDFQLEDYRARYKLKDLLNKANKKSE